MKRPLDCAAKSQAICAVTIGLRGKATAIAVPSSMRSVAAAACVSGRNGLCDVSDVQRRIKAIGFDLLRNRSRRIQVLRKDSHVKFHVRAFWVIICR